MPTARVHELAQRPFMTPLAHRTLGVTAPAVFVAVSLRLQSALQPMTSDVAATALLPQGMNATDVMALAAGLAALLVSGKRREQDEKTVDQSMQLRAILAYCAAYVGAARLVGLAPSIHMLGEGVFSLALGVLAAALILHIGVSEQQIAAHKLRVRRQELLMLQGATARWARRGGGAQAGRAIRSMAVCVVAVTLTCRLALGGSSWSWAKLAATLAVFSGWAALMTGYALFALRGYAERDLFSLAVWSMLVGGLNLFFAAFAVENLLLGNLSMAVVASMFPVITAPIALAVLRRERGPFGAAVARGLERRSRRLEPTSG